jgi:hypothetical protein
MTTRKDEPTWGLLPIGGAVAAAWAAPPLTGGTKMAVRLGAIGLGLYGAKRIIDAQQKPDLIVVEPETFEVAEVSEGEVAQANSPVLLLPIAGLFLVGPFVVTPWIVKQFKPEWSYGKRVATGFVVSFGVGALTNIARAAGGGDKDKGDEA